MILTVTIIMSILILMFIVVLLKENLLNSIGKLVGDLPTWAKLIVYATAIGAIIFLIVLEILKFK